MTLILSECHHAGFVIVTADTRYVERFHDPITLEPSDELFIKDDVYDKAIKLTDNVILSVGGMVGITELWKQYMIDHAKPNYYLDDLEPIMQESLKYLKELAEKDPVINKYLLSKYCGMHLDGFYSDGTPGRMILGEKIDAVKIIPGYESKRMFAPTEDILERKDELLDYTKFRYDTDNLAEHILKHFMFVHSIIAAEHNEVVSNFCKFHFLGNDNGRIVHADGMVDLTGAILGLECS